MKDYPSGTAYPPTVPEYVNRPITHHTYLLNALIEKYGLKSYLEIGVQNPANNFDKVKCGWKMGIDPDINSTAQIYRGTSDMYFSMLYNLDVNVGTFFDLIFIDGLHHADQVKRDFENSLRCLSDNGFILIHDVLPENEAGTIVPRETKKWWGDVYKWAMTINQYPGIGFVTFNIDNGCMLVWKMKDKQPPPSLGTPINWNTYEEFGKVLLNVTDAVEI